MSRVSPAQGRPAQMTVKLATLKRALEIAGSEKALSTALWITHDELNAYLNGKAPIPNTIYGAALDVLSAGATVPRGNEMAIQEHSQSWWERTALRPFHLPFASALYLCSGLFLLLTALDVATPPQLNLSFFYAFVILLATWNMGLSAGIAFAVWAAAVQWYELSQINGPDLHTIYWFGWLGNRWFMFFIVVALIHPLRIRFEAYRDAARFDPLTGAANTAYFDEMLQIAISRSTRIGEPFGVAFVDCDNFKSLNDQHGHRAGDAVLRAVVKCARRNTRKPDTIARLGGDEFALILPTATEKNAQQILDRIRLDLAEDASVRGFSPTLSAGLATFDRTELRQDQIMELCDMLMYQAKHAGKGRTVSEHYPPDTQPEEYLHGMTTPSNTAAS